MASEVFISYSHEDLDRIDPIIELIRALKQGLVFQDRRSIPPGKRWKPQLLKVLRHAKTIIVFWCEHAAKSPHVKEECEVAVQENKDILPLILDDTFLPKPLNDYQGIDLRGNRFHQPRSRTRTRLPEKLRPHFYPTNAHGEYVDWESEWEREDNERMQTAFQTNTREIAQTIVMELEKRDMGSQ